MQEKLFILASRKPAVSGSPSTYSIPIPLTSLIGREREVVAVSALLQLPTVRLVSLTGPGGVGKTHLSQQIAYDLLEEFADGICFVPLASINDPALVIPTIAQALGLKEAGDQVLFPSLKTYLQDKGLLLLLDNFEQVIEAAPQLVELLVFCPLLKMLVTSRAVLHVRGEHEYTVPPLALPDLKRLAKNETLAQFAAVALFLERAKAARPTFQMTTTNARVIAQICVHLDGLPLAIELAAARIKVLPPQDLLERLERRLPVLTSGSQDLPVRQQTLRNTIQWSYDLLHAGEQQLFRRLSVFIGGCTLQAIEAVCTPRNVVGTHFIASGEAESHSTPDGLKRVPTTFRDGEQADQILDIVTSLIDKSLLQWAAQEEGEQDDRHLIMLEMIRQYGWEALVASGEAEIMRHAHAMYYLELVEEAEQELRGPMQALWLERLEREHDNLRTALQWSLEQTEYPGGQERVEIALRMSRALARFWQIHGHISEGCHFLEQALLVSKGVRTHMHAQALNAASTLLNIQGDTARSEKLAEESLALYRELADKDGIALALYHLGHAAWMRGDLIRVASLLEESMELSREQGDSVSVAYVLFNLAGLATIRGEYSRGMALFEESLALFKELHNKRGMGLALLQLAELLFISQDGDDKHHGYEQEVSQYGDGKHRGYRGEEDDQARIPALLEEGLLLCQEVGDKDGVAFYCYFAGRLALDQADLIRTRSLLEESLALYKGMGDRQRIVRSLAGLAKLEAHQNDYAAAQALYKEGLRIASPEYKLNIIPCLEGLAHVVAQQGEPIWAIRLWGAANTLRTTTGAPLPPVERADYERSVAAVRAHVGDEAFSTAWTEGSHLSPEQALVARGRDHEVRRDALDRVRPQEASGHAERDQARPYETPVGKMVPPSTYPDGLTAREVEVLQLVAQALTNAQVAEKLVITSRTVNWYLTRIYSKIQVSSRSAATRYAIEHHLL